MAAYLFFTGALSHTPSAVDAGRQVMLFFGELRAALLYLLGRRLGLKRWTVVLGDLAFSLSPLALGYHRQALLDNLATPLLIGGAVERPVSAALPAADKTAHDRWWTGGSQLGRLELGLGYDEACPPRRRRPPTRRRVLRSRVSSG